MNRCSTDKDGETVYTTDVFPAPREVDRLLYKKSGVGRVAVRVEFPAPREVDR